MDAVSELAKFLESANVRMCFCTLCCHQPEYGHCYSCHCKNHVPEPLEISEAEVLKLKATVKHLMGLLRHAVGGG